MRNLWAPAAQNPSTRLYDIPSSTNRSRKKEPAFVTSFSSEDQLADVRTEHPNKYRHRYLVEQIGVSKA